MSLKKLLRNDIIKEYEKKMKSEIIIFLADFKKRYNMFPWNTINKISKKKNLYNDVVKVNGIEFTVKSLLDQMNKFNALFKSQTKPTFFHHIIKAYSKDALSCAGDRTEIAKMYNTYKEQLVKEFKKMDLNLDFCMSGLKAITALLKDKNTKVEESVMSETLYDIMLEKGLTSIDNIRTTTFTLPADFNANGKESRILHRYSGEAENITPTKIQNDQITQQINSAISSYKTELVPFSSLSENRFAVIVPNKAINSARNDEQKDLIAKFNNHLLSLYYNKDQLAIVVAIPIVNKSTNPLGIKIMFGPAIKLKTLGGISLTDIDKDYYISAILLKYNLCLKDYTRFTSKVKTETSTPNTTVSKPVPAPEDNNDTATNEHVKELLLNGLKDVYKENMSPYEKYELIKGKIYEEYVNRNISILEREDLINKLTRVIYTEETTTVPTLTSTKQQPATTNNNNDNNVDTKVVDNTKNDITKNINDATNKIQSDLNNIPKPEASSI